MKVKLLLIVVVPLLLLVMATAVIAQEEPPAPYSGLKNPFPWDDTSAQQAGKGLYQQSCLGCHGVNGDNIAEANFSAPDFSQRLEESPDFSFWVMSEGRLNKGMPPFKSSLSEEQRWQVLAYLWSLGAAPAEVTPQPAQSATGETGSTLLLTAPEKAQSGQPLTLKATVQDSEGKPIGSATVKFFLKVDFFASGLMEIGKAITDGQGVAVFQYTPQQTGEIPVIARYEAIETATTVSLLEGAEYSYQAETGLHFPAPGPDILIGPKSATNVGEGSSAHAPMTAFRLPGGILSWLLILVVIVMFIWFTYFRVMYQVFRIPIVSEIKDIDTRLIPLFGLGIVMLVGTTLALVLLTGPYNHLHLPR